jgi:F-type H+-transporting ATPase subunit alpha
LDAATQKQLARGQRLRELLKQPQYSPLPVEEQVAIIYAGINGFMDEVPVEQVVAFSKALRDYIRNNKPKYAELIRSEKKLGDESETLLKEAIAETKQAFLAAV